MQQPLLSNGKIITQDPEGYLCDLTDWTPELAVLLAAQEDLVLTDAHWEIINYLREFYQNYQHTPAMRALVKALQAAFGSEKANSIYLQQLFPAGPAQQASRVAGLPKPSRCM